MNSVFDDFDLDFDHEYLLFADEPEDEPGVYIVHTEKEILEIGETTNLKEAIETNYHIRGWLEKAQKSDIYIAFHIDNDPESRKDKLLHLQTKL